MRPNDPTRFEIVPHLVQVCPDGSRASVTGAVVPGAVVEQEGWTYRDKMNGTTGGHRIRPGMSRDAVAEVVESIRALYR